MAGSCTGIAREKTDDYIIFLFAPAQRGAEFETVVV
jgi:hypothetical protein